MLKTSTGLRTAMLDSGSMRALLDGSIINIYSGTAPASADAAIGSAGTNVLLCTVSLGGTGSGLSFEATAADGAIPKATGAAWSGTNLASGTASFYRHVLLADTGTFSTTASRLQGDIALAGAELNLSSTALTAGAQQTIDHYVVALPTF